MKKLFVPALAAAAFLAIGTVHAIPFTSSGNWTGVGGSPSDGPNFFDADGLPGDERVEFGAPFGTSTAGPSAYVLAGEDPGEAPLDGTEFLLATFTHENFTISLPSISGASVAINLDFGASGSQDFNFNFVHNETSNDADPCDIPGTTNPCPDGVSIPEASSTETITIDGVTYMLMITGFQQDGEIVDEFVTTEGAENSAGLFAKLVEVQVPLPSTLALFGAALFGFGVARRRMK